MDKAWLCAVSLTGLALLGQARLGHLTGWEMPLAQPTDLPRLGQAIGSWLVQVIYGADHLVTTTFVQWQNQAADATKNYHI